MVDSTLAGVPGTLPWGLLSLLIPSAPGAAVNATASFLTGSWSHPCQDPGTATTGMVNTHTRTCTHVCTKAVGRTERIRSRRAHVRGPQKRETFGAQLTVLLPLKPYLNEYRGDKRIIRSHGMPR